MNTDINNNTTNNSNPNHHHHHHSSPSSSSSNSRPSSSTTQACAACKYQRRKCSPTCQLAPYFPADHHQQFLNAHKLFGVSNILKIIRGLDPQRRSEAMGSIIFQSEMRARDPVFGCSRVILELQQQYEHDCTELAIVLHQLALHHAQVNDQQLPAPNEDVIYENNLMITQQQQQQYYDYFYFDGNGGNDGVLENNNQSEDINLHIKIENHNENAAISSNSVNNDNDNDNEKVVNINGVMINANEMDMEVPELTFSLQQQAPEDDVKPFIDVSDITHALAIGDEEEDAGEITSKAADLDLAVGSYHCSEMIQQRKEGNPMEHVQEHDLKGAASLFTLTSRDSSSSYV